MSTKLAGNFPPILKTFVTAGFPDPNSLGSPRLNSLQTKMALEMEPSR
ncbi:hypothetical protein C427_1008 [Paraglaciecola psychrophila 170]|uniref:Uncharacterized protein n=1 Tax=Paraglaciecola psychrophila 170 TaxID=1129794 RepID=K7ADV4_9ALTE|nr:hypothetical protein C427_1008 [Paraglaciecola psychrophila 170]GAC38803.1 hypothetical protein GPSY_3192 [Paraglaciecola psychrophila 170]